MSLGLGLNGQVSFKISNSDKKTTSSDISALKRLDVPDYDPSSPADPGNLAYDGNFIKYFNGSSWVNLGSGGSIQNAPDTDPTPNPNFLVNSALEVRNIKSRGNGVTLNTSGNSLIFNYNPSFTATPSQPHIKLWDSGFFPYIYSNTLPIAQDSNGNYSIEFGSAPTPFPAENCANDLSINTAEIVEPVDGKLRLLVPREGMTITQADPNNNYITFIGYDGKFNGQTVGSTSYDFVFPMLTSEAYYYTFIIKGINVTDSKLYYFELRRSITNFGGNPVSSAGTNIYETSGDLIPTPAFLSSVNSFSIRVFGLTGRTINWSLYMRKV